MQMFTNGHLGRGEHMGGISFPEPEKGQKGNVSGIAHI